MHPRLVPNRFCLLLLSIVLITGCVKNPLTGNTSGNDDPPEITATGTPTGTPVTKAIGASGGSLVSADGKLTLTVPAGALSNNLDITIQPITNEAPGGIGNGYDLLPSGTIFNTPVTLTYHYTDDDINGSNPYFIYIATQDSTGGWTENVVDRDLDTVGNTVSITTPHFSSYVLASSLHLEFGQTEFREGESNNFKVMETFNEKDETNLQDQDPNQDYLPPLPIHRKQLVPNNEVSHWSLNDQGVTTIYGNIIGTGSNVTFTAPDQIDQEQSVKVSAQISGTFVAFIKKKKFTFNEVIVIGHIKLIPSKFSFQVEIKYHIAGSNPCFVDNYTDGATMQVDVNKDVVTISNSNIVNQPPSTFPTSGPDNDGTQTCTWVPDNIGLVNITGASGTVSPAGNVGPGVIKSALITVTHQGTILPEWTITDLGGSTSPWGGTALPGWPPVFNIILRDSTQVVTITSPPVVTGPEIDGKITITPIH